MSNIVSMVKDSAHRTTMRHYRSQPMPESYSKPFGFASGKPQPSIMQQAFLDALVKA